MTTRAQIAEWYDQGVERGATHMIIKWDTFDGPEGDYPIYVFPSQDAREVARKNGDVTVEVYSFGQNRNEQLAAHRVWNWE